MPIPEEPMSSLKKVEDLSLRFSIEGDTKINGELDAATRQKELIEAITRMAASSKGNPSTNYYPGRRQWLFVIATDCYDSTGEDFDALVCKSGSEMYYPWRDMVADADYEAHVEYRWPGDNVRSTVTRLARIEGEAEDDIMEYVSAGSSRCYSYSVKLGAKTRKIDDLRQRLRMRGFRCNLVYTRATSRLNVVPLFASRIQAIRYLSIIWGIDLSKVAVFVGEKGDTDYEDLLAGLHKTIILRGSVEHGSEKLLCSDDSFKREDGSSTRSP